LEIAAKWQSVTLKFDILN